MAGTGLPHGSWTSEGLAQAIKQGDHFQSPLMSEPIGDPAPPPAIRPPAPAPPHRIVRVLRHAVGRLFSPPPRPELRVLVDVQAAQGPSAGRGIGRYTLNLLHGLARVRPAWRFEAVGNGSLPAVQGDLPEGVAAAQFHLPAPEDIWGEANDRAYGDWLLGRGADAILLTDLMTPTVAVPTFRGVAPPVLAVLYDLIPLLFPDHYLTSPVYLPHYVRRLRTLLACDGVLAISQSTADDFRRLFVPYCPPTANIRGAVDAQFHPHPEESLEGWGRTLREQYGVEREFLLYVGGPDHRKNLKGAVRAFALVSPERRGALQLVIACALPAEVRDNLIALARSEGVFDRIVVAGRVSDAELIALYQLGRLFVFPSLYEGLGLPILEAMSCGSPVVCGDNSSLPEFSDPWAHLADASDPRAFARAIEAALAEPRDLRRRERLAFAARFTWEETAERAAVRIEECVAARPVVRNENPSA